MYKFKILDILHTGHHGEDRTSKVGIKYDERRNKEFCLSESDFIKGAHLIFYLENHEYGGIITTAFKEKKMISEDIMEIETLNSIYVCQVLEKEN